MASVKSPVLDAKNSSKTRTRLMTTVFDRGQQVGEGTYGKVYKGRWRTTGESVALKRIRIDPDKDGFPITAIREIKLLQRLHHPNVLHLREIVTSPDGVYLAVDYMDFDLTALLAHPRIQFQSAHIKCILAQILAGLGYLHSQGILHRDIKGSNILLNRQGQVRLADFGLARFRQLNPSHDYTNRVITLWYRPPELLLGATFYGPEVDIWGVGCIMIEMFLKKSPFRGVDECSQLDEIYQSLGTLTADKWPGMRELPWYYLIKPQKIHKRQFEEQYGSYLGELGLSLANQLLCYNPQERITAQEALKHSYFTNDEPLPSDPASIPMPDTDWHEFDTKQQQLKRQMMKRGSDDKSSSGNKKRSKPPSHPSSSRRSSVDLTKAQSQEASLNSEPPT